MSTETHFYVSVFVLVLCLLSPPYPSPPAPVSRIKLVSHSVAFGIRSRTFSLGKSMATGTVSVPLPLPTLYSGPRGKVPWTLHALPFIYPFFRSSVGSGPCSPGWEPPGRRKMKCWKSLRNVGSFLLCQGVERDAVCCQCSWLSAGVHRGSG